MDNKSFSESDKDQVIDFLNLIAEKAEFKLSTKEVIKYYKLLAHMQQTILPKINSHIMEIKKVIKPEPKKEEPKKRGRKPKKA